MHGEPHDLFGSNPRGYLILTPKERAMALTTAQTRKPGDGDAQRAELHRSMLAYTRKYRVEATSSSRRSTCRGTRVGTAPQQRRRFRIEGDKLFIESAPGTSILFPRTNDYRRILWEREQY